MSLVLKALKSKVANMLLINDHMLDEVEVEEGVALEAVEVEAGAEVEKIPTMKITRIPKPMQRSSKTKTIRQKMITKKKVVITLEAEEGAEEAVEEEEVEVAGAREDEEAQKMSEEHLEDEEAGDVVEAEEGVAGDREVKVPLLSRKYFNQRLLGKIS